MLKGNEGAWQMLVNTYSRRIFSLAYQFSGTREEAEDMTQEIFLKLYNSLKKFDFSRNFDAWLLTLARNHLIDEYRRTKWEKKTRDEFNEYSLKETTEIGPEDAALREETKKRVWEGFNHLSADIRMTIILRDIQGKKYEEVAEIMDLPLGTIKSRVNRGRIQLAKVLKEQKEKENGM
jgi:RNA polymerase sigma-70 factor (ECF subfamily)